MPLAGVHSFAAQETAGIDFDILLQLYMPPSSFNPFPLRMDHSVTHCGRECMNAWLFQLEALRRCTPVNRPSFYIEPVLNSEQWEQRDRLDGLTCGPTGVRILCPLNKAQYELFVMAMVGMLEERGSANEEGRSKKRKFVAAFGAQGEILLTQPSHEHVRSSSALLKLYSHQVRVYEEATWVINFNVGADETNAQNEGATFSITQLCQGEDQPAETCSEQRLQNYFSANRIFKPPAEVDKRFGRWITGAMCDFMFEGGAAAPSADNIVRFAMPTIRPTEKQLISSLRQWAIITHKQSEMESALAEAPSPMHLIVNGVPSSTHQRYPDPTKGCPVVIDVTECSGEDDPAGVNATLYPVASAAKRNMDKLIDDVRRNGTSTQRVYETACALKTQILEDPDQTGVPWIFPQHFRAYSRTKEATAEDRTMVEKLDRVRDHKVQPRDSFWFDMFSCEWAFCKRLGLTPAQCSAFLIEELICFLAHDCHWTPLFLLLQGDPEVGKTHVHNLLYEVLESILFVKVGIESDKVSTRQENMRAFLIKIFDECPKILLSNDPHANNVDVRKFWQQLLQDGWASAEVVEDALDVKTGLTRKRIVRRITDGRAVVLSGTNPLPRSTAGAGENPIISRIFGQHLPKPGKNQDRQTENAAIRSTKARKSPNQVISRYMRLRHSSALVLWGYKLIGLTCGVHLKIMELFTSLFNKHKVRTTFGRFGNRDYTRIERMTTAVVMMRMGTLFQREPSLRNMSPLQAAQLSTHMHATSHDVIAALAIMVETDGRREAVELVKQALKDMLIVQLRQANQMTVRDSVLSEDRSGIYWVTLYGDLTHIAREVALFMAKIPSDLEMGEQFVLSTLEGFTKLQHGNDNVFQLVNVYEEKRMRWGVAKSFLRGVLSTYEKQIQLALREHTAYLKTLDGPKGIGSNRYSFDEKRIVFGSQIIEILTKRESSDPSLSNLVEKISFYSCVKGNSVVQEEIMEDIHEAAYKLFCMQPFVKLESSGTQIARLENRTLFGPLNPLPNDAVQSTLLADHVKIPMNSVGSALTVLPSHLGKCDVVDVGPLRKMAKDMLSVCVNPDELVNTRVYVGQAPAGDENPIEKACIDLQLTDIPEQVIVNDILYEDDKTGMDDYVDIDMQPADPHDNEERPVFFTGREKTWTGKRGDCWDYWFLEDCVESNVGGKPEKWILDLYAKHKICSYKPPSATNES